MSRRNAGLLGLGALTAAALIALVVLAGRGPDAQQEVWGAAEAAPVRQAGNASTVVTGDGTVLAAWTEVRRGLASLMFSQRPAGGDWSAPVAIQDPQAFGVRGPSLTADAAGNAVVTFGLWARQEEVLMAAYRPAGGAWEAPQALAPAARGLSDGAAAVTDGVVAVTWTRPFVSTGPLVGTVRPAGTGWVDGVPIGPASGENRQRRLAVMPGGGVVLTAAGYGRTSRLAVFERSPGGAWTRLPRPSAAGGPDLDAAVAADRSGRPVIAWTRLTRDGGAALWTSTFEGGAWTAARRLDHAPGSNWFGALTAATTRDGVVIAWTRWRREWTSVEVRAAAAGGPARTLDAFAVPDIRGEAGGQVSPEPPPTRVLLGAGGDPVAMWDRLVTRDPTFASEMVVSRARGGAWGSPEAVREEPVTGWPLAVGATGDGLVATWAQYVSPENGGIRVLAAERPG